MKPLLAAIALINILTGTCTAQTDSLVTRKHFPIKSCRVVFKFVNGPQSGTKTVIFDDWGNLEKEEGVTMTDTIAMRKVLGSVLDSASTSPETSAFQNNFRLAALQHTLIITTNGQRYIIDLDQHTGVKGPILIMEDNMEGVLKQTGFVFARLDTLLGKPCEIWEAHGAFRFWVWNKFYVLKKELMADFPASMRVEEYATEIDESYSIKPDEFKVPDNIIF
jgi:hypothetical protein